MDTQQDFSLAGKVAIVTGASRGIGRALAVGLATAGADVAVLHRGDVEATMAELSSLPVRSRAYVCDLANAEDDELRGVVDSVVEDFSGLDILVNNAGAIHVSPAVDHPITDWDEILRINVTSAFLLSRAAGASFIDRGIAGSIINIASLLSFLGGHSVVAYTASKSALAGVTRTLAVEWGGLGIRVNAIAPGYIVTDNTRRLLEDKDLKATIDARIPAGRWGQPADIVGPAVFLASDASRYVNGVVLPVDGGILAN